MAPKFTADPSKSGIGPAPRVLRFRDLKQRGIVENWPTLLRLIEREGFPPGIRLGPNMRAFPENEIAAWLESRRINLAVAE